MFDGLKSMLRQRDFLFLLIMFFVGLGMFNGVSTWVEDIVRPRGFSISQAGALGGLMLVGGIVGAVIIPLVSDKSRRRKPFIFMAFAGLIPGLIGMTFATSYGLLLLSGFVFGFFLLSAGPIGFQYAAEITHPAPEGTSNSLLLLMGQISGHRLHHGHGRHEGPGDRVHDDVAPRSRRSRCRRSRPRCLRPGIAPLQRAARGGGKRVTKRPFASQSGDVNAA